MKGGVEQLFFSNENFNLIHQLLQSGDTDAGGVAGGDEGSDSGGDVGEMRNDIFEAMQSEYRADTSLIDLNKGVMRKVLRAAAQAGW